MSKRNQRRRGFTLIELMMVVAIIGLLTSVAIPMFQLQALRSKQLEIDLIMPKIEDAMKTQIADSDSFSTPINNNISFLFGTWNPPLPYSPQKKQWNPNLGGWPTLVFRPNAMLYHNYFTVGIQVGSTVIFYVYARGDLDGDGQIYERYHYWRRLNGKWSLLSETETPGRF